MRLELKVVDLLTRNPGTKFTINQIAKSLEEHYSLVHRTIGKMINEGLILEEKIGKSHVCSANINNEKILPMMQLREIERNSEFYSSNKEAKLILGDFIESVKLIGKPLSVVLFGSYAKGTATNRSDIDILLITKSKTSITKITKELYAKYGKEINAVIMTPDEFKKQKNKPIIKEIIENHYTLLGVENFVTVAFR